MKRIFLKPLKRRLATISTLSFIMTGVLIVANSCDYDYFPQPPPPPTSEETEFLEAVFVSSPPKFINSSYWATADYLKVEAADLNKNDLYPDGYLNMTGTYNGKSGFNNGNSPEITLKAAYDKDNLYILAEWKDNELDLSYGSWLWNGPADPLKADSTTGWTRQRNSDRFSIAFEIEPTSSPAGNFATIGCAASCHNGSMKPQKGKVDLWEWSMANSEPLGYASDLYLDAVNGISPDQGKPMYDKNSNNGSSRSGPAYEWSGEQQTVTKGGGGVSILDPAYFLMKTTAFKGDHKKGITIINQTCSKCHGKDGSGGDGPAFNRAGTNRLSRKAFIDFANSPQHQGYSDFKKVDTASYPDLMAGVRSLSGVPGIVLQTPEGSCADVHAISSLVLSKVLTTENKDGYRVLLIRKLNSGNTDDVQFDPDKIPEVVFGVALMDDDGKNHIGSTKEKLIFK